MRHYRKGEGRHWDREHIGEGHALADEGQGRQPTQLHGQDENQEGGDEEHRHRDEAECPHGDAAIEKAAGEHGGEQAEPDRQRHRDDGGEAGQLHRVADPIRNQLGDFDAGRERLPELTGEQRG